MKKKVSKKDIYITYYTKEYGKIEFTKIEFTREEWERFIKSVTLHREDGPAMEWADGFSKQWFLNGKLHRIDGPAVEWATGDKQWSVEYADGDKEWWIDNKEYSEKDFDQITKEVKALPLELKLTDPRDWVREWK
jgi:hypothetical protein